MSTTSGGAEESPVDAASCVVSDSPVVVGKVAVHMAVAFYTTNCVDDGTRFAEWSRVEV